MLYSLVGGRNSAFSPASSKELDHIDFSKLLKSNGEDGVEPTKNERLEILRTKVKSIARLSLIFKNLRKNNEMLVSIKNQSSDGKIPKGLLLNGSPAIRNALNDFKIARYLDKPNEKYP